MTRTLAVVCAALLSFAAGCSSDDEASRSTTGSGGTGGVAGTGGGGKSGKGGEGGAGSGGAAPSICVEDGGIYGSCEDNTGCFCLQGATVYQFCTVDCSDAAECGDPAATPGAVPGCFPINPGAQEMICALTCTDNADCPCGLVCTASGVPNVNICAELQ